MSGRLVIKGKKLFYRYARPGRVPRPQCTIHRFVVHCYKFTVVNDTRRSSSEEKDAIEERR